MFNKSYFKMKREQFLMRKFNRLLKKFNRDENLSWYPKFVIGYDELEEQNERLQNEVDWLNHELDKVIVKCEELKVYCGLHGKQEG
jgi:hypothetical protein